MQEDGWIKVCKEDVSELIHRYKKGMFWSHDLSIMQNSLIYHKIWHD